MIVQYNAEQPEYLYYLGNYAVQNIFYSTMYFVTRIYTLRKAMWNSSKFPSMRQLLYKQAWYHPD